MDLSNETKSYSYKDAKYRPYVSVDIETTGISDDCAVIQIAGVFDDGVSPINELKTFNQKIRYRGFYSEPVAIKINQKLLEQMASRDEETQALFCHAPEAGKKFLAFLEDCFSHCQSYDTANELRTGGKLVMAGKNVAAFDDPKLRILLSEHYPKGAKQYDKIMSYKTLDPGSMYYTDFGYNPSLSAINEITGRNEVTHDAIDDAFDVVYAVRHKAGML